MTTLRQGNRWFVENKTNEDIVVNDSTIRVRLFVSKCINADVTVAKKTGTVVVEGCSNANVNIESGVVGTVEMVNCANANLTIRGPVPTVQMDMSANANLELTDAVAPEAGGEPFVCNVFVAQSANMQLILGDGKVHDINAPCNEADTGEQFMVAVRGATVGPLKRLNRELGEYVVYDDVADAANDAAPTVRGEQ